MRRRTGYHFFNQPVVSGGNFKPGLSRTTKSPEISPCGHFLLNLGREFRACLVLVTPVKTGSDKGTAQLEHGPVGDHVTHFSPRIFATRFS